jgi:hypothetical protein
MQLRTCFPAVVSFAGRPGVHTLGGGFIWAGSLLDVDGELGFLSAPVRRGRPSCVVTDLDMSTFRVGP